MVGDDETTVLRRNKGQVDLADLVGHQEPNVEAHLEMFKAAQMYQIAGLRETAISRFHEVVLKFKGHPEVERVLEGGLPFSLKLLVHE